MSETRLDRKQYVIGDPSDHVGFLNCERIRDRSHIHGWSVEPHYHEGLTQLFIFDVGQVSCKIDYKSHKIKGPALVWLPALCSHAFEYQVDMEGWIITLPTSDLTRITGNIVWLESWIHRPHLLTGEKHHARLNDAIKLAQRIEVEHRKNGEDRNLALEALLMLLLISLNRGLDAGTAQQNTVATQGQKLVNQFRALLDKHMLTARSVSQYATMLNVTPTHLSRTVKMVSGQTAGEVICDRVMLEAKRKLVFSDQSMSEIAYALQFSSPSYFTRFFSAHAGQTPRSFRNKTRIVQ